MFCEEGVRDPFLESPGKYIFKYFFADYTVITDMVLGKCFLIEL